jgi:methionyl-tRNA synthetase
MVIEITSGIIACMIIIGIWELIWKGIALWKAGRNNQLTWFVFLLIVNSVGILPIIYLAWFQKRKQEDSRKKKKR